MNRNILRDLILTLQACSATSRQSVWFFRKLAIILYDAIYCAATRLAIG